MINERLIELVRTVEDQTRRGELTWEATIEETTFQATLGGFTLRIAEEPGDGGPDYRVSIVDSHGRIIDSASNRDFVGATIPSGFIPYEVLRGVFEGARRVALGADRAIDSMLSALKGGLRILSAKYGAGDHFADFSRILNEKIVKGRLEVVASNDIFGGDPVQGTEKQLTVAYSHSGKVFEKTVKENGTLVLP